MTTWYQRMLAGLSQPIPGQTDEERDALRARNRAAIERLKQGPVFPGFPSVDVSNWMTPQGPTQVKEGWKGFTESPLGQMLGGAGSAIGRLFDGAPSGSQQSPNAYTSPGYGSGGTADALQAQLFGSPYPMSDLDADRAAGYGTTPGLPTPTARPQAIGSGYSVTYNEETGLSQIVNQAGQVIGGLKSNGEPWYFPGMEPGQGEGGVVDMGNAWLIRQPNGTVAVVNKPSAPGAGTQFDYAKDPRGFQMGLEAGLEKSRLESEGKVEQERVAGEAKLKQEQEVTKRTTMSDELKATVEREKTKALRDNSIDDNARAVRVAEINQKGATDAAQIASAAMQASAMLEAAALDRQTQAQIAKAAGDERTAMAQIRSAEKIAAAKAEIDAQVAQLNVYGQLLAVESQERGRRAEAAASVFNTLAQMAPQDQLRSAFYTMRGQAPPPSTISQIPPGLFAALGVNPDTASAAAQQMRGQVTVPPWMQSLLGGTEGGA